MHSTLQQLKKQHNLHSGRPWLAMASPLDFLALLEEAIDMRCDLDTISLFMKEADQAPKTMSGYCCYCEAQFKGPVETAHERLLEHTKTCLKHPTYLLQIRLDAMLRDNERLRTEKMELAKQVGRLSEADNEHAGFMSDIRQAIEDTGEFENSEKLMTFDECVELLGSRLKTIRAERNEMAEKLDRIQSLVS